MSLSTESSMVRLHVIQLPVPYLVTIRTLRQTFNC